MKRATYSSISYMLLCIFILSCNKPSSSEEQEADLAAISEATEQYFEGNLCYSPQSAFFEESISGEIIPVDMKGLSFMIETEFPEINEKTSIPIHVKLFGHLTFQSNEKGTSGTCLTINSIKEIKDCRTAIDPMVGIYNGNGQKLTIAPDHSYSLQDKNGNILDGRWYLYSPNIMVLLSGDSKTVMRINYKKRCLNSREDLPTIFTLAPDLSNR